MLPCRTPTVLPQLVLLLKEVERLSPPTILQKLGVERKLVVETKLVVERRLVAERKLVVPKAAERLMAVVRLR